MNEHLFTWQRTLINAEHLISFAHRNAQLTEALFDMGKSHMKSTTVVLLDIRTKSTWAHNKGLLLLHAQNLFIYRSKYTM